MSAVFVRPSWKKSRLHLSAQDMPMVCIEAVTECRLTFRMANSSGPPYPKTIEWGGGQNMTMKLRPNSDIHSVKLSIERHREVLGGLSIFNDTSLMYPSSSVSRTVPIITLEHFQYWWYSVSPNPTNWWAFFLNISTKKVFVGAMHLWNGTFKDKWHQILTNSLHILQYSYMVCANWIRNWKAFCNNDNE